MHFDNRNVPPTSGAEVTGVREYMIPPLEIGLMNDPAHRRRFTPTERAALGYGHASGTYYGGGDQSGPSRPQATRGGGAAMDGVEGGAARAARLHVGNVHVLNILQPNQVKLSIGEKAT